MSAPYFYDKINAYNSIQHPSTMHASDTGLSEFFEKYLLEKAMSPFKFTLPETWSRSYFLYSLYLHGFVSVFNTAQYGTICQHCGLSGFDIFYQPTTAIVANPLISFEQLTIGENCELIKLQPDYTGIGDIVAIYADLMAVACEALSVNVMNSKLSYILISKNKSAAESLKLMTDKVLKGEPAVAVDAKLFSDTGEPLWTEFAQNLKQNFIAPDLIEVLRNLEQQFDAEIGLPNANTGKRERMITDEVNVNNFSTRSKCEVWLEELQTSIKKVKAMFPGLTLEVDWREDLQNVSDGDRTAEPLPEPV